MVVVVVVTLNFNDPLEDNLLGAIDTGENGDVVRIKCVLHFLATASAWSGWARVCA